MKAFAYKKLLTQSNHGLISLLKRTYTPETKFNLHDPKQQANKQTHDKLSQIYKDLLLKSTLYTPHLPKATDPKKKLPTRQRIEHLLDEGSFFLELSQLAGHNLYPGDEILCGGLVSGIGLIHNKACMIIANDYSQKGGSYFPITIKKKLRAQEIAEKLNLPCLYLVDSAGANLPRQSEVFPDRDHFGRIFYNISRMSAKGVPQIAIVLGSCTAGGAYVPAMCDESVIVQNQGTVFLAGPPLVKAATGEVVSAEELGGGETHTKISGVCDYLARDEFDAFRKGREIISNISPKFDFRFSDKLALANKKHRDRLKELEYLFDPTLKDQIDSRHLIDRLVDSGFSEFKPEYGKTLITGFGNILGQEIGFVGNNGVLFSESALKAAHFIQICNQRNIPLLFLQNITGFMVGKRYEWDGIAKHGAKMVNAVANARVPKITLLFGASFGAGNYGMCGRAYSPDFLFSWPTAKISVMGGQQAANVMLSIKKDLDEGERVKYFGEMKEKYEREGEAIFATARLWDDGIVVPEFTREVVGLGFLICLNGQEGLEMGNVKNFGVFRM